LRLRTDASRRFKKIENAEAMTWEVALGRPEILAHAERTTD